MTLEDLDALEELHRSATAAPWYVRQLDDDYAMGAITILTEAGRNRRAQYMTEVAGEIIAACLVQHPQYVMPDGHDDIEDRIAALIAASRTALPELVRL